MRIIAHRGNTEGPSPLENDPYHCKKANKLGFQCEIDVWQKDRKLWAGHDNPVYELKDFANGPNIYHCKNVGAYGMLTLKQLKQSFPPTDFFMHDAEPIVRTYLGLNWVHPIYLRTVFELIGPWLKNFIAVMPENTNLTKEELRYFGGICTDYALKYKEMF